MTDVGDADGTTPLIFYLGLAGDDTGRAEFARAVSDPTSAFYGAHLTVAQVAARYGASTATQAAVVQYFAGLGLAAGVDVTGTYASVTMPLSTAETIFGADWRGLHAGVGLLQRTRHAVPDDDPDAALLPGRCCGPRARRRGHRRPRPGPAVRQPRLDR